LFRHFTIQFDVTVPFIGHIVLVKNGVNGALRNAVSAVNASFGIDEDHRLSFVKAFGRANNDAVRVLAVKTGFCNNHRHEKFLVVKWFKMFCTL